MLECAAASRSFLFVPSRLTSTLNIINVQFEHSGRDLDGLDLHQQLLALIARMSL